MRTITALWLRNIRGFVRDRVKLITSLVIPFFFLYVFNSIFQTDQVEDPIAFLLAGIIVATVFQTSLNIATSTIDDTVSGYMKEILVSPTSRFQVALGQITISGYNSDHTRDFDTDTRFLYWLEF
ncbi:MAG: ABC transporter permease [Alkalibacterium sp.]|nr:ABC transporter permease [Alkalibacterium sp.]